MLAFKRRNNNNLHKLMLHAQSVESETVGHVAGQFRLNSLWNLVRFLERHNRNLLIYKSLESVILKKCAMAQNASEKV